MAVGRVRSGAQVLQWREGQWSALHRLMQELPARVVAKEVGKASNKAVAAMLRRARRYAPRRTGLFRRAIGRGQKLYKRTGVVYTIIGVRTGYKDPITLENPAIISHLIEFGTDPHLIAPRGEQGALKIKRGQGPTVIVEGAVQHPGSRAFAFMRTAYDEEKQAAIATFGHEIITGIGKEARALAWKKSA